MASNNNNLEYLNQLEFSLPLAPTSSIDGSPSDANLDQFMDSSFFDFDALYNTTQFQQSQSQEKANLQQLFQTQMAEVENVDANIPSQEDFLNQFIKSEVSADELKFKSLPHTTTEHIPASVSPSTISPSDVSVPSTPSLHQETETDKKKRNTAASARFRIKKKLREQEMERTLKNLTERVHAYNARIQQLEFENKCLKGLIIERNDRKSDDMVRSIKQRSMDADHF